MRNRDYFGDGTGREHFRGGSLCQFWSGGEAPVGVESMRSDNDDVAVPERLPQWARVLAYVLMAAYYGGRLDLMGS
jgi:hypothetical protein